MCIPAKFKELQYQRSLNSGDRPSKVDTRTSKPFKSGRIVLLELFQKLKESNVSFSSTEVKRV